jgi:hypothetical protein
MGKVKEIGRKLFKTELEFSTCKYLLSVKTQPVFRD